MKISELNGVGAKRAHSLHNAGICTVADLLNYFPRDYDDRSQIKTVAELMPDAVNTIRGVVASDPETATLPRKGAPPLNITKIVIKDHTGALELVWFNQPYLKKYFKKHSEYIFTGKVRESYGGRVQMQSPEYEISNDGELSHGRIVPVYTTPKQFSQKTFRALMHQALEGAGECEAFAEYLPVSICEKYNLCGRETAIHNIHFPKSDALFLAARRRLVFEELFFMQSALLQMKDVTTGQPGIALEDVDYTPFLHMLPFPLTNAQNEVLQDIARDTSQGKRMNRLIQGDVGSGKTVVAMAAAYLVMKSGYQAALMVPTEVLANQHFEQCSRFFEPLGFETVLLTGSLGAKARREALAKIGDGCASMVIGTHALIQEKVEYAQLGLAITDEQHRFGVNQRMTLTQKASATPHRSIPFLPVGQSPPCGRHKYLDEKRKFTFFHTSLRSRKSVFDHLAGRPAASQQRPLQGMCPHTLVMTATPIPRTLGMILYGDLDISIINELPPGRQVIQTYSVNSKYQPRIHAFICKEVEQGRQVYVICPAIEACEDTDVSDTKSEIKNVIAYTAELSAALPDIKIAYLHGKMKPAEKQQIMEDFKANHINVLVSTTVIEVGVHVANATLMIIENAERFGLSQLHQLRGRVGRGKDQSYCILVTDAKADETKSRMKAMCDTADGFKLAELDLKLRGAGDFFGTRQHGLPSFAIANLYRDMDVLKEVQVAVLETLPVSEGEEMAIKKRIAQVLNDTHGGVM